MKRILSENSKTLIILLAIIAGSVFYYFVYNNKPAENNKGVQVEKQTIKMGTYPVSTNLPLFVAQEKGFFSKNGLNVELKPFQDGGQANNAIFTGKVDGGDIAIPVFLAAQASSDKLKIKIVSVQIEEKNNPIYELIVPKDITSYSELEGKKIGYYPPTPATKITLEVLLDKKGVNGTTNIKFAPTTLVPAFQAGDIDAIFSIPPLSTLAKKNNLGRPMNERTGVVAESMGIVPLPAAAYILSNDLIEKRQEAAKSVIKSLDQAVEFIRNNPDESRKILGKYLPKQQQALLPYLPIVSNWKSTEIKPNKIKAYQQLLLEKGVLKKAVDIDSLLIK